MLEAGNAGLSISRRSSRLMKKSTNVHTKEMTDWRYEGIAKLKNAAPEVKALVRFSYQWKLMICSSQTPKGNRSDVSCTIAIV